MRHFYRYLYEEFTTLLFTSLAAMFSVSPPMCQYLALFLDYCFFYCQVFLASEENYVWYVSIKSTVISHCSLSSYLCGSRNLLFFSVLRVSVMLKFQGHRPCTPTGFSHSLDHRFSCWACHRSKHLIIFPQSRFTSTLCVFRPTSFWSASSPQVWLIDDSWQISLGFDHNMSWFCA